MAAILNIFSPEESYLRNVSISHLKDLIYTRARGGRAGEVSIEELVGGWWCLKILAGCHHPRPSLHSPLLRVTYTSLTSEGNYIPFLVQCVRSWMYRPNEIAFISAELFFNFIMECCSELTDLSFSHKELFSFNSVYIEL